MYRKIIMGKVNEFLKCSILDELEKQMEVYYNGKNAK